MTEKTGGGIVGLTSLSQLPYRGLYLSPRYPAIQL